MRATVTDNAAAPVKKRYVGLDALRGFAILGIILANYPELSLWTFRSAEEVAAMPGAGLDRVIRWLQYIFIDGKFYTLFSLLFGTGFSIILSNLKEKGVNGNRIFLRRMLILAIIGFIHLMVLWSGDILMLYALMGMLLPLFTSLSDKKILSFAGFFLALPVISDAICSLAGISLSEPLYNAWLRKAAEFGINENNMAQYLSDSKSYSDVQNFLIQGSIERMYEFVDSHRYFKVLGLFLIGYVIGRRKIYADLEGNKDLLRKISIIGLGAGLPLSLIYAAHAMNGYPAGRVFHSFLYLVSVYPTGFGYAAFFCLLFLRHKDFFLWKFLAKPGRMACTNYLGQSLIGIILFYGAWMGLGRNASLAMTELIALAVYALQAGFSAIWLEFFRYGPVEWIWRMLTYKKLIPMKKWQG